MNKWQKKIHREVMCSFRNGAYGSYKQVRRGIRVFHAVLKEIREEEARESAKVHQKTD